jgi:hypothetical protein
MNEARISRPLLLLVHAVAVLVFALSVARLLGSPLRFDEVEFADMARWTAKYGVPKVPYADEPALHPEAFRIVNGRDAHLGMWHPPMYVYSLALGFALLGASDLVFRGVGLAWLALSFAMVFWTTRSLRPTASRLERLLPITLALLNPFVVEAALYLDIDNTALTSMLLVVAAVYARDPDDLRPSRLAGLAGLFALALACKLTSPVILLGAIVLFDLLDGRPRAALVHALVVGGLGFALFAAAYVVYCRALDYPAEFMFNVSYLGKKQMYTTVHSFRNIAFSARWHLVWLSPAFVVLLVWTTVEAVREYTRTRRPRRSDLFLLFAWMGLGTYVCVGAMIGKYAFPAAIAATLAIADRLADALLAARVERPARLGLLTVSLLAVHLACVPELQLKPAGLVDPRSRPLLEAIQDPRGVALAVTLVSFGVFAAISRPGLAVAALAYLLAANPVNQCKSALAPYDRSPLRPLPESGFRDTIAFLTSSSAAPVIVAPKDVGYYYRGPHWPLEALYAFGGEGAVRETLGSSKVTLAVDSTKFPLLTPDIAKELVVVRRIGDFVVYSVPAGQGKPK